MRAARAPRPWLIAPRRCISLAMSERFGRIVGSARFQHFVTGVILLAAILVGLETSPSLVERYGHVLHALDRLVLGIFVLEIALKLGAEGTRPWRFFRDPWNVFDFAIVALAFLPIEGTYVTVLRLARLLRALRLIRAVPRLQILVGALLKSIPSMGYVSVLLLLVFYMYGVAGVFLFGKNDPFRFGTLARALITLFQVATAEDWSTTLYTQMYGCAFAGYDGKEQLCTAPGARPILAPFYFISFILIGTMIILNLFIGVIMNSMSESQREAEEHAERERLHGAKPSDSTQQLGADLESLERQLADLQQTVRTLARRAHLQTEARPELDSSNG
jgi:voltage-gated sodium channel